MASFYDWRKLSRSSTFDIAVSGSGAYQVMASVLGPAGTKRRDEPINPTLSIPLPNSGDWLIAIWIYFLSPGAKVTVRTKADANTSTDTLSRPPTLSADGLVFYLAVK